MRKLNVTAGVGGRSYINYQKVPQRLEQFCKELNAKRRAIDPTDSYAVYELSFWAHFELVTIHPWADGNGRTCRLLMNLLQMEYNVLPTKILNRDKAEYIQALIDTRETGDLNIFIEYMTKIHVSHLQEDIQQFENSINGDNDIKGGQKRQKVDRKGGQKTREKIITLITGNAKITTNEMSALLGINRSALSKHLKHLQEDGTIQRIGPDKGGHWVVLSNRP